MMMRREQRNWSGVWSLVMLSMAAAIGLWMAVWQGAPVIFLFTLTAEAIGVLACSRWRSQRLRVFSLFAAGYLARVIAASLSWAMENRTGSWIARFASDGQGNFEASQQPLPFAISRAFHTTFIGAAETGVNATGWLMYNRVVTLIGDFLGGAHPLANLQMQLLAGAMLGPVVYALAMRLQLPGTGRWAAWIVALHPMLIAYSAALVRDETISLLGFLVVVLALDSVRLRRQTKRGWLVVALVLVVLLTLRVQSAVYFAGVAGVFVFVVKRGGRAMKRFVTVALLVALGLGVAFGANVFGGFGESRWTAQTEKRADTAAGSSIGVSAMQRGALFWVPAGVVLHFIAPFPFFRQFPDPDAGFLRYWAGLGALANQFLLGFFIIGALIALMRGERAIVLAAVITIGFAVVSTITFGDPARYMSAHGAPFVALIAVYGYRRLGGMRAVALLSWSALLIATHVAYFVAKAGIRTS